MSDDMPADDNPQVPQVLDRIADEAQDVGALAGRPANRSEPHRDEPVIVHETLEDRSIAVTLEDGRITELHFDAATSHKRASTVSEALTELINRAMTTHEAAVMEQLRESGDEFGELLASLGQLRAELHAAYSSDLRALDG